MQSSTMLYHGCIRREFEDTRLVFIVSLKRLLVPPHDLIQAIFCTPWNTICCHIVMASPLWWTPGRLSGGPWALSGEAQAAPLVDPGPPLWRNVGKKPNKNQ